MQEIIAYIIIAWAFLYAGIKFVKFFVNTGKNKNCNSFCASKNCAQCPLANNIDGKLRTSPQLKKTDS